MELSLYQLSFSPSIVHNEIHRDRDIPHLSAMINELMKNY